MIKGEGQGGENKITKKKLMDVGKEKQQMKRKKKKRK